MHTVKFKNVDGVVSVIFSRAVNGGEASSYAIVKGMLQACSCTRVDETDNS